MNSTAKVMGIFLLAIACFFGHAHGTGTTTPIPIAAPDPLCTHSLGIGGLHAMVDQNLFTTKRGLARYNKTFSKTPHYTKDLARLGPKDKLVDLGAGAGQGGLDYAVEFPHGANVLAIGKERPEISSELAALEQSLPKGRYRYLSGKGFLEYSDTEIGPIGFGWDYYGIGSYEPNITEVFNKYFRLKTRKGKINVLMSVDGYIDSSTGAFVDTTTYIDTSKGRMKFPDWIAHRFGDRVKVHRISQFQAVLEISGDTKLDRMPLLELDPSSLNNGTPPRRIYKEVGAKILFADEAELANVQKIQQSRKLTNGMDIKQGFLVHLIDGSQELSQLIKEQNVLVHKNQFGDTDGFSIAYPLTYKLKRDPEWERHLTITDSVTFNDIKLRGGLFQHMAKAIGAGKEVAPDLARGLQNRLFAEDYGYSLGEIALEPKNEPSYNFHLRLGYREVARYRDEAGMLWGVFAKDRSTNLLPANPP